MRCVPAAIGLIFVAPLVAEFLLGNLPMSLLPALVVLAPMYGGAALLIRETARRANRGWPTMLLLGAAYALIEEGFVTQSLFNHDYLKLQMHLLDHAYIPSLGIGAWWTLFMLNLHSFWSVSVSIALVEALVPSRARAPWLGRMGDWAVGLVFLLGLAGSTSFTLKQDRFVASPMQFAGVGAACLALILVAFLLPGNQGAGQAKRAPNAWLTWVAAWVLGVGVLIVPSSWDWGGVGAMLAVDLVFLGLVGRWARGSGWTQLHELSLGAGGAMAYGSHAFFERPAVGHDGLILRIGNVVFLAGAVALIVAGVRRCARTAQPDRFLGQELKQAKDIDFPSV